PGSLLNARVPAALTDGVERRHHDHSTGLAVTNFSLDDRGCVTPLSGASSIELAGRIVLPCFIDSHAHLDKAFIVQRTGLPEGGLLDAVQLSMRDATNRTEADLRQRMEKGLQMAYANGTIAIRTHLDTPDMPANSSAWAI